MARLGRPGIWFAAALLALPAQVQAEPLDNIKQVIERLHQCWRPPPQSQAKPVDITILVSFNREGAILGRPRVSYETEGASDNDRLAHRIAAMEALERCTPLQFSEALGGAIAGRPFAIRFWTRKTSPKPIERQAWLTPKIR